MIARILAILLPKGSKSAQGVLVVSKHDVGEALHPQLHMPVLLPNTAARYVVAPSDVSLSLSLDYWSQNANKLSVCPVLVQRSA